jgi:hypothetical protein
MEKMEIPMLLKKRKEDDISDIKRVDNDNGGRHSTSMDLKTIFQVFLPIIIAAGSAFVVHERNISQLTSTVELIQEDIRELKAVTEANEETLTQAVLFQKQVDRLQIQSLADRLKFTNEKLQTIESRLNEMQR